MGSKVPYGIEEERPLTEAAKSLWDGLWQSVVDPFDPRATIPTDDQDINGLLSESLGQYGTVLAHGLDTLEEAFAVQLLSDVLDELEKAKAAAAERTEASGRKTPVLVDVGGEEWQVSPMGAKGGIRFWLSNDWATVKVRPGQSWGVSIRYSAEALWSYGPDELVARARLWLGKVGDGGLPDAAEDQWARLSEVHHAVDVHSTRFTAEMEPELWRAVVAPAGVKSFPIGDVSHLSDGEIRDLVQAAMRDKPEEFCEAVRAGMAAESLSAFASGGKMQTLTIGFRRACEVQVYDKGREIREASGKEWQLDIWEQCGRWTRPEDGATPTDCWRLEMRVRKDWLRDRGVVTWADWQERGQRLLVEVLSSRRLTRPTNDSNRSRWPAHDLWQLAAAVVGYCDKLAPLGRRFLDTAKQRCKMMLQQAVGCLRAAVVVVTGDYTYGDFCDLIYGSPEDDMTLLGVQRRDQEQEAKLSELIERYRYIPRLASAA